MTIVLRERYRLEHRLGSGGAADVHRATDTTLQRSVAVKVLRDVGTDPSSRDRFVAEARTLAALSHRNLVTVLDAGIDDGVDRPFLVMELVEGRSLSEALRDGPLPSDDVARIGSEVASALAFAHERGIVHRDVKPGNVLLSDAGAVKLADFGIAKILDGTTRHTRTGTAIGTAAYLSPEQVRGEPVTGAVDVYALGLVLLEALTGTRAFPGSPTEAALARLHRDPEVPEGLPGGWSGLLTAMTAAHPAARPGAAEVSQALASGTPRGATVPAPRTSPDQPDDPTRTALLTAPVAAAALATSGPSASATPAPGSGRANAPGRTLDRAGDAIARTPGLLLARWRGLEPHQRGVAGALAAIVLLVLVTGLAAGASTPAGTDSPVPVSQTPVGRDEPTDGADTETDGTDEVDTEPADVSPVSPLVKVPPGKAKGHSKPGKK